MFMNHTPKNIYRMLSLLLLLAFSLLLVACSQESPTAAVEQPFANICSDANKGERVAVQGFLRLPDSFSGDLSIVLRLYETDTFSGIPIGAQIRLGSEPNQVENVPTSYTDDDLQVHLANGQAVGYGTKVKLSGKVYFPSVDQDFVCGLENVLVEPAS